MKKRYITSIIALFITLGVFVLFLTLATPKVYASETEGGDTTTETTTEEGTTEEGNEEDNSTVVEESEEEETTTLTEEEKEELSQILGFITNLNKEELLQFIDTAKNWLIAGGIVTIVGFISAIIGLIASFMKLAKAKVEASEASDEQKKATCEKLEAVEARVTEETTKIKELLLSFVNNLSDEDRKALENNLSEAKNIRSELLAAIELDNTNGQEE